MGFDQIVRGLAAAGAGIAPNLAAIGPFIDPQSKPSFCRVRPGFQSDLGPGPAAFPAVAIALPADTIAQPSEAIALRAGMIALPSGGVAVPSVSIDPSCVSIAHPRGAIALPAGAIAHTSVAIAVSAGEIALPSASSTGGMFHEPSGVAELAPSCGDVPAAVPRRNSSGRNPQTRVSAAQSLALRSP